MKLVAAACCVVVMVPVVIAAAAAGSSETAASQSSSVPPRVAAAYEAGARWCPGLRWSLLAAVGQEESRHGAMEGFAVDERTGVVRRTQAGEEAGPISGLFGPPLDGRRGRTRLPIGRFFGWHGLTGDWLRAVGPMQILPPTFEGYGVDADGDGAADPHDFDDAAASAARVLCGSRGTMEGSDVRDALRGYNNSSVYVERVLSHEAKIVAASGGALAAGFPVCPVAGPTSFTDTWHTPRSGGRLHKGVDIFADRGTPVVAPAAGTVRFRNDRLGGLAFYLWATDGTFYYGAHLDSFGPREGEVAPGDLLGTVGTTGNAATTPPHLHFEVHPGRGPGDPPAPVNPTNATRQACG